MGGKAQIRTLPLLRKPSFPRGCVSAFLDDTIIVMNAADAEPNHRKPAGHPWRGAAGGVLLLAAATGIFMKVNDAATQMDSVPVADTPEVERAELQATLEKFFDSDAKPLLAKTRGKDLAAIAQVLNSLDAVFKKYAEGTPKFASALTGWGMRFKIMYRKGVESAEGKAEHTWTQELIQQRFAEHVMSDATLEKDLLGIMKQFNFDLEANRNEMLAGMETKLAASNLPVELRHVALEDFKGQFQENLQTLLKKLPEQSVGVGVGSIAAGIVAEEAVRQIVRTIIAELAVRIASSAAVAGGAAGGAAAAGASGGTAIAPGVGTVIGLAGGFIVGAMVDWWMTDEFEEKISKQCNEFLDTTKASLLDGEGGLKKMLVNQIEKSSTAYEQAIKDALQP